MTPSSAREAQRHLEDLASPVGAFVRDRCYLGPELDVDKDELWTAWKEWCGDEGAHPGQKALFIRNLRASVPDAVPKRPTRNGRRVHVIAGIGLGTTVDPIPAPLTQSSNMSVVREKGKPRSWRNQAVSQGCQGRVHCMSRSQGAAR